MRKTALLTVLLLVACGEDAPPALTVGPVLFSEDQLLGLSQDRREHLGEIAAFGLAVSDSSYMALGGPLLRQREEDLLLEYLAAELTLEKNDISDAVLEATYLNDPDYELTVRHILFFSERWRTAEHRAEAEAKAQRALAALQGGADFAETAARLSEEPGAEGRQGLLTPGREGAWVDEFWAAASALEVGGISPVTETQYGYHILRLEGREVVPFSEARSDVALWVANRIEDPEAVLDSFLDGESVEEPARRSRALEEAAARGIVVPPAAFEEVRRDWDDLVYRWATALGFAYGMSPEQVAAASLAALAETRQGATIARDELARHGHLMREAYDIVLAPSGS